METIELIYKITIVFIFSTLIFALFRNELNEKKNKGLFYKFDILKFSVQFLFFVSNFIFLIYFLFVK